MSFETVHFHASIVARRAGAPESHFELTRHQGDCRVANSRRGARDGLPANETTTRGAEHVLKKKRRQRRRDVPAKGQAADTLTVAWMMSVMANALCAAAAVLAWVFVQNRTPNENAVLLMHYLHFSAIITGLVSLALLVVVLKRRRPRPPRGVIALAVIVAVGPILAIFF